MKTKIQCHTNPAASRGSFGCGALHWAAIRALAVIALVLGTSTLSLAAQCDLKSLQDYINLGAGGCTENDLKFSSFSYTGDAPLADAKDVSAAPFASGVSYGLIFTANWAVTGTDLNSKITYTVTALNNMEIFGEALISGGATFSCNCTSPPGDGALSVTEGTLEVNAGDAVDVDTFPAIVGYEVETEVDLTAGPLSSATLSSASNLFTLQKAAAAPEPATWATMLIGFFGLCVVGFRGDRSLKAASCVDRLLRRLESSALGPKLADDVLEVGN